MIKKPPDLEKERSERKLTPEEFITEYNGNLPDAFPRATKTLLEEFKKSHRGLFKGRGTWSLGDHRKKFMDWLPQHIREISLKD